MAMKNIKVEFNTLDGDYCFDLDIENNTFNIVTNISYLQNKSGTIINIEEFINKVQETCIHNWEKEYSQNGLVIDDGVKWKVQLDGIKSCGYEGYWPYKFDLLIDAMIIIDEKVECFRSNVGDK